MRTLASRSPVVAAAATSLPKTQTRVVVIQKMAPANDPATNIRAEEAPMPVLQPGQVLVKVTARPVNPSDLGVYPGFAPASYPAVPGLEGAGVVADAGDSGLVFGARGVVFFDAKAGHGSWQEYVAVPKSSFMAVPDSISDATASQFLVNPVTALGLLTLINAPKGEYVLQSAGGSTLGRLVIALAKQRGVKTISTVRRAAQAEELKALGADEVILESEDVAARVMEITRGKGAWGATDCVAGGSPGQLCAALRPGGVLYIYGAMKGREFTASIEDLLFRDVTIKGFWLGRWIESLSPADRLAAFTEVVTLLADGSLTPHTGATFDLADAAEAVRAAQVPARDGKVLLVSK